jgi:hypothetical protein
VFGYAFTEGELFLTSGKYTEGYFSSSDYTISFYGIDAHGIEIVNKALDDAEGIIEEIKKQYGEPTWSLLQFGSIYSYNGAEYYQLPQKDGALDRDALLSIFFGEKEDPSIVFQWNNLCLSIQRRDLSFRGPMDFDLTFSNKAVKNPAKKEPAAYAYTPLPEPQEFSIRNGVKLGMTPKEVEDSEGKSADIRQEGALVYENQTVAGQAAQLIYLFSDEGKLYSLYYVLTKKHIETEDFIDDYYAMNTSLKEKYGEAHNADFWKGEGSRSYRNEGLFVLADMLTLTDVFYLGECVISHELRGKDHEIHHLIVYEDRYYVKPEEETTINVDGL